jgi:hypothetical protein
MLCPDLGTGRKFSGIRQWGNACIVSIRIVRSNDFRICRGYRAKQQKRENETNSNARTGFHIQLISVIYDNYILSSPYPPLTADPRHEFLRANFMPDGGKRMV